MSPSRSTLRAWCGRTDRSIVPGGVKSPGQIRLLVQKLTELNKHCPVTVAMESSGTYGDPLRQALTDAGLAVRRVSAKAVKDYAETFDGVPSQHDGKDAAIIGTLCMRGHGSAWPWIERSDEDCAIRYWVRKLDTGQRIKQVWCGKLESMLARHARLSLSKSGRKHRSCWPCRARR